MKLFRQPREWRQRAQLTNSRNDQPNTETTQKKQARKRPKLKPQRKEQEQEKKNTATDEQNEAKRKSSVIRLLKSNQHIKKNNNNNNNKTNLFIPFIHFIHSSKSTTIMASNNDSTSISTTTTTLINFGLRDISNNIIEDYTPEDVDNSEAGWSTDFAITLLAILYMITAFTSYNKTTTTTPWNFFYMHLGTAIAHLGGGLAHAIYPNRASDGTGMIGFYISIMIGYYGNCMRYGLGWGFESKIWILIASLNAIWLLVAAIFTILEMERTNSKIDDAQQPNIEDTDDDSTVFLPDTIFLYAEVFCAIMEMWASIWYVCRVNRSKYAITAVVFNLIGWMAVYVTGLWSIYSNTEYDTRITQLIYHYSMIVFLWSINELALLQTSNPGIGNVVLKKKEERSSSIKDDGGNNKLHEGCSYSNSYSDDRSEEIDA